MPAFRAVALAAPVRSNQIPEVVVDLVVAADGDGIARVLACEIQLTHILDGAVIEGVGRKRGGVGRHRDIANRAYFLALRFPERREALGFEQRNGHRHHLVGKR